MPFKAEPLVAAGDASDAGNAGDAGTAMLPPMPPPPPQAFGVPFDVHFDVHFDMHFDMLPAGPSSGSNCCCKCGENASTALQWATDNLGANSTGVVTFTTRKRGGG
jgi:hypothetical protein